ncbi:uncharacterized protein BJ212DRAFT_440848 [Suillus subaureus]|uniref:DUF6533 domain-containing protein n=1 Tax=Suillus subaureus TaxID=48587 RepID=A0A9P7JBM7_9AGAM|nr:uncharacterized protein BJ212DRAFT_440848 [Suillus subaureus]KAG1812938.1 hypothetical protein BJ212DRAFT_440848 [Suillus subaureus]
MSDEEVAYALRWNNNIAIMIFGLISYEYILHFEKEVKFVWTRKWSMMTYLYLAVRYFGVFLAMLCACWGGLMYIPERVSYVLAVLLEWGFSIYFWLAEVILIWRLYALYQSRSILYVLIGLFSIVVAISVGMDIFLYSRPVAFSGEFLLGSIACKLTSRCIVQEIVTPNVKYCTSSFNIGPMPAIYASIPIVCFDIFLVILAVLVLVRHLRERREIQIKPNTYIILIVRCHIIYFLLNLTNQILMTVLWANIPPAVMSLSEGFINSAPVYCCAPSDCQHLGYTCQRRLRTYQYGV